MSLSLWRHKHTGDVYVKHEDGRAAGPLDHSQWSADGGKTPRPDWVEQPYDLKDGMWSSTETFEFIAAAGAQL